MSLKRLAADKKGEIQSEKLLYEAAADGDVDLVSELLHSGVSVDAEDYNKALFYASKNYMTPLQIAAAKGFVKCVEVLIRYGADVNAKDRFDVTAMHMAAEKGNCLCLKALLDAGAECSLPTKYSKSGCYTAVPHLGGTTPLHLAAMHNRVECVKELIQYGADYNAVDERGRTSLYIAAKFGFEECVMAHLKNAVGRDILSLPSFESLDTPLHFVVCRGLIDCVRELINLGSDVNQRNYVGYTPLHMAVTTFYDNHPLCFEILRMLVLEGYNVDINQADGNHFTPLHYVCFKGRNVVTRRPDMAVFLMQYGAAVNIKNSRGIKLLECELKSGDEDLTILKAIVKSKLCLPHLREMKINFSAPEMPTFEEFRRDALNTIFQGRNANAFNPNAGSIPDLPYEESMLMPEFRFMSESQVANHRVRPQGNAPARSYERERQRPLPTDNSFEVGNHFLSEGNRIPPNLTYPEMYAELHARHEASFMYKKFVWYETLACNPRTLQHCCRYAIRKALTPCSLKHVWKLPIPPALQSYVLLEYGD